MSQGKRTGHVHRHTNETDIEVQWNLDGGESHIATSQPMLDHLLGHIAKHSRTGLVVNARGDLQIDPHHLSEDVGITMGQALHQALGERRGIERYADASIPLDETLVQVVLDISGRPYLGFDPEAASPGQPFTAYHAREFLKGFTNHGGLTLHVRVLAGREIHHVLESTFKALGRCLRSATAITSDHIPSTKGSLTV